MIWFWQSWLAAMVFVFPIPHTIALRNLLLFIGIIVLVWNHRHAFPKVVPWLKPAAWWLVALTAWIVFHSVAVASAPTFALDQFRANWLNPLLIGAVGAWAATQLPRGRAAQAVVVALAAHMIWLLGWQFHLWLGQSGWPFKATPFGAYDYQGTLNCFLLTLVAADRVAWVLEKYSPLALGRIAGSLVLLLSLASDLALQSRNSTAISVATLLAAGIVLLAAHKQYWRNAVVVIGIVAMLAAGSLSFDKRWAGLREGAVVGWTSTSLYWMTSDASLRPVTSSGAPLEESVYSRAAWLHQAIDLIAEHPLGLGFGHDAFGRGVALKYGHPGLGSSHSGWADFALGTGLVGLALLLATTGAALRCGWRRFRDERDGTALLLAFLVGGYVLRCLLDGHLSGWRLGLFAFLCGVLIAAMKPTEKPA
ncbi:MAG: O-antigen ligase family protein [Sulfuritalea sp.]|nr:O-antigen ligase family protein [Sulfuritalea sp.]